MRGDAVPAYLAVLRRLAARRGLAARIFFEPPTASHETVAATKEAADIGYLGFADPSLQGSSEPLHQFFRYVAAGLAVCVAGPSEISRLTHQYGLGRVIDRPAPEAIAEAINRLTRKEIDRCKKACRTAAEELDWRREQGVLLDAVGSLFGSPGPERGAAPAQPRAVPTVAVPVG
jgi:hypothetical protein